MKDKRPPVLPEEAKGPKRSKYGNKRVTLYGEEFDSQAEMRRYLELLQRQNRGEISGVRAHPTFELQPAFRDKQGGRHYGITYTPDFEYFEQGQWIVEDVKGGKGTQTEVWRVKAKLFRAKYPEIELRIVES